MILDQFKFKSLLRPALAGVFWGVLTLLTAMQAFAGQAVTDSRTDSIHATELPAEAQETLALIRSDGPFPYSRDGAIFANRERLLPRAPRASYREYTVRTPGRRDRGARRIVARSDGECYYTEDHYRSFRRILE